MKAITIIMITAGTVFCNYQKSNAQCHMMNMNHSEHDAQASASGASGAITADSSKTFYTCTMHPEIKLDKPGNCPKCGMALVAVKEKAEAKDKIKNVFQCPMKCEGEKTYDKTGDCPKCGMALMVVKERAEAKEKAKVEFQCPMKCEGEKIYDQAGNCPKCGMALQGKK